MAETISTWAKVRVVQSSMNLEASLIMPNMCPIGPGALPAVQMANQLGLVFARLDCTPRWRERLAELAMPTLLVHGRRDPFFPVGNGEALAQEIPVHGSSYSNGPRRRSPTRLPERSRRRC